MIFHYIDASAWVKRYYREAGSDKVADLFDGRSVLACATLGVIEIAATLARKRKARDLSAREFRAKSEDLSDDWEQFVEVRLTDEVAQRARDLASSVALRGADAVHLASALHLEQNFVEVDDALILVTSDAGLREAARLSGLSVFDPQQQDPTAAPQTSGVDRLAAIRRRHPNAYLPWSAEDDERLRVEHVRGTPVRELSALFMRQPNAIRSRLRRLGLS